MTKPKGFHLSNSQKRVLRGLARTGPVVGFCEAACSAAGRELSGDADVLLMKQYFDAAKALADAGHIRISPTRSSMRIQLMPSGTSLLANVEAEPRASTASRFAQATLAGAVLAAAGCSFLSGAPPIAAPYIAQMPPPVQAAQFHKPTGEGSAWAYCTSDCPKPTPKTIRLDPMPELAPPAVPQIQAPKPEKFSFSADVLFDFDSAIVSSQGRQLIDSLGNRLKSQGELAIEVVGYTDRLGSDAYNLKLSRRRADAVKDQLAKEISAASFRTSGLGKADPLTDDKCAKNLPQKTLVLCLQPDRRVEVHVAQARRP